MRSGRRPVAYHSEDEYRLQARKPLFHSGMPYRSHMEWRDEECALLGTRRLMALARKTGRPAHILHVSTASELELLRDHRDVATVELLVNHLTQWAPDVYDRLGGFGVMNPPIRGKDHWEAAWAAVRDGTADTIGSDHAPHLRAAKLKPWPEVPAGLTGVQTLVPLMLDHVAAGRLSLARMVDLMCAGPARVYGAVGKGRLAAGYDADFTLVDLKRRRTIEDDWIVTPVWLDAIRRNRGDRLAARHDHSRPTSSCARMRYWAPRAAGWSRSAEQSVEGDVQRLWPARGDLPPLVGCDGGRVHDLARQDGERLRVGPALDVREGSAAIGLGQQGMFARYAIILLPIKPDDGAIPPRDGRDADIHDIAAEHGHGRRVRPGQCRRGHAAAQRTTE